MLPLNHNLQKLFGASQKNKRLAIGLMSGTSLDGLDIALCKFAGCGLRTQFELIEFTTIPYPEEFKAEVRQVFAKKTVDLEKLSLLNAYIGIYHGELVLQALAGWEVSPRTIDFIASHGQTIYHAPKRMHQHQKYGNATLQIGDGDHLAHKTGIMTISDFRQKHIAAGGEGAPLALYGDVLLGSQKDENRILLNLGGIANLTWLPGNQDMKEVLCADVGPGNTLIDAACKKYFNKDFDEGGEIAASGSVNETLLEALLDHSYFTESLPKTTGPELFNLAYVENAQKASDTIYISHEDVVATLTAFTAKSVAGFIQANISETDIKLFVSGGGAKNPVIIEHLNEELPDVAIGNTNEINIDPDAKEAILFALLGNESLVGEPLTIDKNPAVLMGKFSFPSWLMFFMVGLLSQDWVADMLSI